MKPLPRLSWLCLWVLLVCPCAMAHAADLTTAVDGARQSLGPVLAYLHDPSDALTIDAASAPALADKYIHADADVPNLGLLTGAVWLRFSLTNPTAQPMSRYLINAYPSTDVATLYIPLPGGGFKRLTAGDSVERSPAMIRNRLFVYPIELPAHSTTTLYLLAKSTAGMVFPLSVCSPETFYADDHRTQLGYGLFFGACLGFIMYFSVVALRLRSRAAAWFVAYVTLIGLLLCFRQGFWQEFVGPDLRPLNNLMHLLVIALLYFVGAKFLRTFLAVRTTCPWADRVIQALQWMGVFYVPMCIFNNPLTPIYALILVGIGPWFSSTVAVVLWLRGVPNSKYFVMGWLLGHFTSTVDLLRVYGLIPYLDFMDYTLPLTMASAMIFFTMALVEQSRQYQLSSEMDSLTGLANRRAFDQHLTNEWNRHLRHGRQMSLIMADVDCFKGYNDTFGHKAGDDCLVKVATVLRAHARRPGDMVARFGGEEFMILLAETGPDEAKGLAEAIRCKIEEMALPHQASTAGQVVTLSLGVVAAVPTAEGRPWRLVEEADKAMYAAKNEGRNRVCWSLLRWPLGQNA